MDIYLSSTPTAPGTLIENYVSLIWTERWNAFGDFELIIEETFLLSYDLRSYQYLLSSESRKVMMIETVDIQSQDDGKNLFKVTGRSFEAFLLHRTVKSFDQDEIVLGNITAPDMVKYLVERYIIDPVTAGNYRIPELKWGYISANAPLTSLVIKRDYIYNCIAQIMTSSKNVYGWQITRSIDGFLSFSIEEQADFSKPPAEGSAVLYREFSPDMENISNTSYLASVSSYKNHALVLGARTKYDVYAPGTPSTVLGLARRTVTVDASSVGQGATGPVSDDYAELNRLGVLALEETANKYVVLVDGDVPANIANEIYFDLGNLVKVRDAIGHSTIMRITEIITSSDAQGVRKVPSFASID